MGKQEHGNSARPTGSPARKLKRMGLAGLFAIIPMLLFFPAAASAGNACQGIDREMAQGQVAVEIAKDAQGLRKAAELFSQATRKAPDCADAHFNLALAQEGVANYPAAKRSFEKYLELSPNAADAAQVHKKIYALEYRLERARQEKAAAQKRRDQEKWLLDTLVGAWKGTCNYGAGTHSYTYHFTVSGDGVNCRYNLRPGMWAVCSAHDDLKFDFDKKRFVASEGFEKNGWYIYVKADDYPRIRH